MARRGMAGMRGGRGREGEGKSNSHGIKAIRPSWPGERQPIL